MAAVAAVWFLAVSTNVSAVRQATPQQLFAHVSSGMVFVTSECDSGQYTATGFLVGPQTMITALHVVEDEDESECDVTVEQEETGKVVAGRAYTSWMTDGPADSRITDLAVVHLSGQLKGYYFKLAASSPRVGERVLALGYSLGNALSLNQGSVLTSFRVGGVPVLRFNLLGAKGSSGGPILNLSGLVVGLTQRGSTSASASSIDSLDLARFVDGRPSNLCDETARKGRNTLCGTASSQAAPTGGGKTPTKPAVKPPPGSRPTTPTPTAPTPPPRPEPLSITDVWFSSENSCDPAKKWFHVAAQTTRVNLITQFNRPATSADATTLSLSVRKPDGVLYATKDFEVNPSGSGWACFSAYVEIAGPTGLAPMAGSWVVEVSLPDGLRKSFSLDVERFNNPFEVASTPSGTFVPSYGSISVTWKLRQEVRSGDTYVIELLTPGGRVVDYGIMYLSAYSTSGYEYLSTYCYSGYYSDTCEYGSWTVRVRRNAETIWSTGIVATH